MRERVSELTGELIRAGSDGAPSIDYLVDKLRELATSSEDGQVNLDKLAAAAKGSKLDFKALAQAYAGNTDDLDELVASTKAHKQALQDQADSLDTTTNAGVSQYNALLQQIDATDQYIGYLNSASSAAQQAAEDEANFIKAGGPEWEAKKAAISAINDAYDETAGSVEDYINAETGLFDVAAYLTALETRAQALRDYQTNLASSGLSPEAKAFLNEQGAEAAALFLDGYVRSSEADKARLNAAWTEAGKSSSGSFERSLTKTLPDRIDKAPTVQLKADTGPADRSVDNFITNNTGRTVKLTIIGVDRNGKVII